MRVLYMISGVLFLILGVANIVQSTGAKVISDGERLIQATVKKKVVRQSGDIALKVSYANKDYWVKVTKKKFNHSDPDKPVLLKYDREKDLLVDDEDAKSTMLPGLLMLAAAVFIYFFGVRSNH